MVNVPRVIQRYIEAYNEANDVGSSGVSNESNSITKYETVDDIPSELEGEGVVVYTEEKGFVES